MRPPFLEVDAKERSGVRQRGATGGLKAAPNGAPRAARAHYFTTATAQRAAWRIIAAICGVNNLAAPRRQNAVDR
jgi:hypothetical protein